MFPIFSWIILNNLCFHGNVSISSRVIIGMQLFIAFHYNTFYYVKLLLMSISDFSNLKFLFFFLVTWSKSLPLFYLSEEQSFVCLFVLQIFFVAFIFFISFIDVLFLIWMERHKKAFIYHLYMTLWCFTMIMKAKAELKTA